MLRDQSAKGFILTFPLQFTIHEQITLNKIIASHISQPHLWKNCNRIHWTFLIEFFHIPKKVLDLHILIFDWNAGWPYCIFSKDTPIILSLESFEQQRWERGGREVECGESWEGSDLAFFCSKLQKRWNFLQISLFYFVFLNIFLSNSIFMAS